MEFSHRPVLLRETVELLAPDPGKIYLDATVGGGGHAEALLAAGARVIGLDQDPRALDAARSRLASYGERFAVEHANFREAAAVLERRGLSQVDGVLVDLGMSSHQLDDAERGFSFQRPGPLDMRMDPTSGAPLMDRLAPPGGEELERILPQPRGGGARAPPRAGGGALPPPHRAAHPFRAPPGRDRRHGEARRGDRFRHPAQGL